MKNGPRLTEEKAVVSIKAEEALKSPEQKKDNNGTKSPEQSGEIQRSSSLIKVNKNKIQL
jgi:hypothetical protein